MSRRACFCNGSAAHHARPCFDKCKFRAGSGYQKSSGKQLIWRHFF
ncbi:hypothetical protein D554_0044 [Bordetella holmesii 30539]|uniref:N-acetyltransferase YedL n=1 Tax=Bordetella holmesii 1058 TaxID=1247648 RepID=A0ABN0RZL3_9BORD|nr:hypothetical protein D560_0037 [Bordetella holmesii ATCC 51541]AIT24739.1 hypothetical protein D558_0038 [Bordetella holmesii 44057]EWM45305.1 hypothetical protein D557_3300 [Bordetella holmesii 70147]EWM48226.1 hypothetical protein D556_0039 [Bordetella holmesii 41130]EWM49424.1 hypothetical protein D555_0040 [Bordetella holmesii 35009]EXF90244.1 hypothetical protein D554_0044 [Bordetella holmesii 30539]EXX94607.1 hypothetical protein D559_2022 [Bordetella holmesii 1058]